MWIVIFILYFCRIGSENALSIFKALRKNNRKIMMDGFLKNNGDVRNLLVYKVANMVSVLTEYFVDRYVSNKSRTTDQMQQAARSCKQNIVEGSEAGLTSMETEIKLTNVARASLGELLDDYLDYLNFHHLPLWTDNNPERLKRMRAYTRTPQFASEFEKLLPRLNPEELCNLAITLINQAQYLLRRMMESQQKRFLAEGGIREQMTRARIAYRNGRYDEYLAERDNDRNSRNDMSGRNDMNGRNSRNDMNEKNDGAQNS